MGEALEFIDKKEGLECKRCKNPQACLITRKERFCDRCFIRFIRGKQRKVMLSDQFKVKYGEQAENSELQRVLLALSLGDSSLALLEIVASHLKEQYEIHQGRRGYQLVVLHIRELNRDVSEDQVKAATKRVKDCFQEITIELKELKLDSFVMSDETIRRLVLNSDYGAFSQEVEVGHAYKIEDLINSCSDKLSAEDLMKIVYDDLILRTAAAEHCQTILYGHSMTRMADEILALTVQGRASSLHTLTNDHTINFRGNQYQILFPLRDVFISEVLAYNKLTDMDTLVLKGEKPCAITKNMGVRDLTARYFKQLDANGYSATASTVVKTAEKLTAPSIEPKSKDCQICGASIYQDPQIWINKITVNEPVSLTSPEEEELKHLKELIFAAQPTLSMLGEPLVLCYGCIVILNINRMASSQILWPIANTSLSATENEVLNQYILSDDDA